MKTKKSEPLTLYGYAPSTFTRTARMACVEKGVAHELEKPDGSHAFGKMPAMRHRGQTLYETLAIVAYVDALTDPPRLLPEQPVARARTLQFSSAAADYVYRVVVGGLLKEDKDLDPQPTLAPFDRALAEASYLGGESPDAADLMLAPMVAYASVALDVSALVHLSAWYDRMQSRASFKETA
jgi:glutathione S-transferase